MLNAHVLLMRIKAVHRRGWFARVIAVATTILASSTCSTNPDIATKGAGGQAARGGGAAGGSASGAPSVPPSGAILPPIATTDDGGAAPAPAVPEAVCGEQEFKPEKLPADLLLVLDRSSSMNEPGVAGASTTKWTDMQHALDEVILATESTVRWGLKTFPLPSSCTVPDGVEVGIADKNHAPILGKVNELSFNSTGAGGTPAARAVRKGLDHLLASKERSRKFMVLATDGEPNCQGDNGDDVEALKPLRDAAAAGIDTFVIGISIQGSGRQVLDRMAVAGNEPRAGDPKFYPVSSQQELVTVLGQIAERVANCGFVLDPPVAAGSPVTVKLGAEVLSRDPANGWTLSANGRFLQIAGAACEKVKTTAEEVKVVIGCPPKIIP